MQENELPLDKDLIWLNGVGSITPTAEIQCETLHLAKTQEIAKWTLFTENEVILGASIELSDGLLEMYGKATNEKHESIILELVGLWGILNNSLEITHLSFISNQCKALKSHLIKNEMTEETR